MSIGLLGGGGAFALNYARHLESASIKHFGIGRSGPKDPAFWLVEPWYEFHALHLGKQLDETMAVLDKHRPEVIVNFAAQGEGAASFGANAPDFFDTNCTALVRLVLELQKRSYLKRFVHIGTSELYGSTEKPAKVTDPLRPSSPYAISKAAFDQYLVAMHKTSGFPMNIVRPSNCMTEGQQLYRIVPKAAVHALAGRKLPLHGGGMAQKSYLHATDLSRAISLVIEKAPVGKIYNVAPASAIHIKTVVNNVAELCGISFEELVDEVPDRVGQDAKYALDATEIAKDTGWTQTIGINKAIEKVVNWVKKHPELLTYSTDYRHAK